jgi:tetratricopeptide (TPR) repeat protein
MKFFEKFRKPQASNPNDFWDRISKKINLDRRSFAEMPQEALGNLISKTQALYRQGISAERAGEIAVSRKFYKQAFTLLPTHIEALDNYAIGFVEERNFSEAIPFFEQSAAAEPNSPLAFVYLVKCYEEIGAKEDSAGCVQYLRHHWPDKSPFIDWSHLENPQAKRLLAPPLEEGQVWKYKTRECDEDSTLWIKLIEPGRDGRAIAHISVLDVCAPSNSLIFISHLPFDATALLASVTSKLNSKQAWDREDDQFGEGYGIWFEAYNSGAAGVFTAPLNEVIEGILQITPSNKNQHTSN